MKQKTKTILGWTGILAILAIPVFLLFAFGEAGKELYNSAIATHTLGEIFGLIAITAFALNFVLSTRLKFIENIFGGLDKVYIVHGILGGTALILVLSHPIFLVLNKIPGNMKLAAEYLLPGSYWSINFGIIALTGLLILIYITLFSKMKYHKWKFTHELMGLVFAFAVLHIFLVRGTVSSDYIFRGYYIFTTVVAAIGLGAFSYSLFLKNRLTKNAVYKIKTIERTNESFSFELEPEHKPLSYKSGQFVFIRFYNEHLSKEPHPFSIASKTDNYAIKIIAKKLGDFTAKLENIHEGDKVSIEGPYGGFHFRNFGGKDQVWLASGIGITPFVGMAEDLAENEEKTKVNLYYVFKSNPDISENFFRSLDEKLENFRFVEWDSSRRGYFKAKDLGDADALKNKEILICGSPKFKEKIINDLIEQGIRKDNIHEEVFDFR